MELLVMLYGYMAERDLKKREKPLVEELEFLRE